jgi:monothiol glutaredoxin
VMLFMKGTPQQPACGFSMRASGALNELGVQYAALDILPDPRIREELSAVSGWPTIPQLFVNGELIGGSDIVLEMYESGELAELLGVEQPEQPDVPAPEPEPRQAPLGLENRLT